jgi:hypothetical protein
LTKEEQALADKGQVMQMYKPDEHSRHFIAHIDAVADPKTGKTRKMATNSHPVLCFVFGIEDAKPAREEGRSMAEFQYSPAQAHEFLFAEGWEKYHGPILHPVLRAGRRERLQRCGKSAAEAR